MRTGVAPGRFESPASVLNRAPPDAKAGRWWGKRGTPLPRLSAKLG